MPRTWLSLPVARTGIRIGRSIADSELRPHLPSWRRYELRKALQAAAEARGEPLSREDCDYIIDRNLATGGLDSAGNPTFHVKGTCDEIVDQVMETAAMWGRPMTRAQAEAKTDQTIKEIGRKEWVAPAIALIIGAIILALLVALH
jgi:hypothetical protein